MTQALYRKWRPQKWDEVIGQEHVITTLKNAVAAGRVAHAYLFAGPRGTGKTTTARLLAKAVNCLHEDRAARPDDSCPHCLSVNEGRFLDLIEIDAASNTSVDDVRDLREKINFSPNAGRFKVYIVDEVHMLSTAAFNALLKTLEEPPPHAIFVLATTEAYRIPATVSSRCQRHEFRRVTSAEIVRHLEHIVSKEGLEVETEALALIARQSTGSVRDAISMLDQLGSAGGKISHALAQEVLGTAANQAVMAIVDAIRAQDAAAGLEKIHEALDAGADPRQFARQLVDYLRALLLIRLGSASQLDASKEARKRMAGQAEALETGELLRLVRLFSDAGTQGYASWQPGLPLELALVEAVSGQVEAVPEPGVAENQGGLPPAEVPPPAQAPTPTGGGAAGERAASEIQKVRDQWRAVRKETRRINTSTDGLLNSCTVLELKGEQLYLGFASETVKTIMESETHVKAAEQALEKVLGRRLKINCVIASEVGEMPEEVHSDGMVAAAMRLGGKIVHSSDLSKPRSGQSQ